MSAHEETTVETEMNATERKDEISTGFTPDMVEENIKANLEPLLAQIFALTQIVDRLIKAIQPENS